MTGTLYIVATPIGNLEDLTPRARQTLADVDLVAAEDTRRTGRLLSHFGIETPQTPLHEHNESEQVQRLVERLLAGDSIALEAKGVSFGTLARNGDGTWDTSAVEGLPAPSLASSSPADPPNLIVRPFHQAVAVVSLRQFTNNAYNHHHGMQSAERFGDGVDADGDGFVNELTRADITAVTVFQATLPPPGQVIPRDRRIAAAVDEGRTLFEQIGCANCHIPALPLDNEGWIYTEPNPFNPPGNLQVGEAETLRVDVIQCTDVAHGADYVPDVVAGEVREECFAIRSPVTRARMFEISAGP